MSIWAWALEPKLAAVLSVFGALTGQIISAVSVRRGFRWPVLLPYVLGGLVNKNSKFSTMSSAVSGGAVTGRGIATPSGRPGIVSKL